MNKLTLSKTLLALFATFIYSDLLEAHNWPGFRGDGQGISSDTNLPLKWSDNEGIKWKTPIPGAGHSSPIIWENRVFVTTAVADDPNVQTFKGGMYFGGDRRKPDDSEYTFKVICLNAENGEILWEKAVTKQRPRTRRHSKNTYASETPVTDGIYVFASFGSAGLYCVDFDGNLIWQRDLGLMRRRAGWGTSSSPVIFKNTVIVNCDSDDESYITALDKTTCEPLWRTERNEKASWSTPFLFQSGERTIIVTNAMKRMRGYDASTGKLLWECAGGSMITVPSPVAARGLIFISSGHNLFRRQPIVAVCPDALGDITPAKGQFSSQGVAWMHPRGGPYVTSPIAMGDYLYIPLDKGSLACYDALTGKTIYEKQKLGDRNTITASPIAGDGRIYIQTEDGECYIIKPGPEFDILAVNKLDDVFCASPAVSAGRIFLRGRKYLYGIGK